MLSKWRSIVGLMGCFSVLSPAGCGPAGDEMLDLDGQFDPDDTGQQSSAIMNGGWIDPEDLGVVNLGHCSGTLLRNNWVLTARHCVNTSLDRQFGNYGGKELTTFTSAPTEDAMANAVAIHPTSGKIAVAGWAEEDGKPKFAVAVYLSNGALDKSFGGDGTVLTDGFFWGKTEAEARAFDVAFQKDGKIVAAGYVAAAGGETRYVVARFHADGSLDTSFDFDGRWTGYFNFSKKNVANSIAVASNGDIVVGGYFEDVDADHKWGIVRLDSKGMMVKSFGTNGKVKINVAPGYERLKDLAIDSYDSSIVAVGYATPGGSTQFAIARVNTNGTMNPNWQGNGATLGTWTTDFTSSGYEKALSVAIDPQTGAIYVAGYAYAHNKDWVFALAKYRRSDGRLVTEFGPYGNGKMYTGWASSEKTRAYDIAYDATRKKIVVVGEACTGDMIADDEDSNCTFMTARYDANGVPDPSYHQDGNVQVYMGSAKTESANGVALDAQGRIVVVGKAYHTGVGAWMFGLARLLPEHDDVLLYGQEQYSMGSQHRYADRVFMHPTRDVVLVRMLTPYVMNNSSNSYSRKLYAGSTASLHNVQAHCAGFGVGSPAGGDAYLVMQDIGNDVFKTGTNASDQSLCQGDSGSSCWLPDTGDLVGVLSAGAHCDAVNGTPSQSMKSNASASFRVWANGIMANN